MIQLAGLIAGAAALGGVLVFAGLPRIAPQPIVEMETPAASGDSQFQPEVGQPGKDVIWVPTPATLVAEMLRMADVKPGERVVDLGSGDGIIAITAARDFGARALGIEYNPDMVALSKRKAAEAGVADQAAFVRGDIFEEDFSDADVVTMYLLPSLNLRLRPTLLAMKPGTRLTSHAFDMGEWEADETRTADSRTAYLWIVPANVDGEWRASAEGFALAAGALKLDQSFQKATGSLGQLSLSEGRLRGTDFRFTATTPGGERFEGQATVQGGAMTGTLRGPDGRARAFSASRVSPPQPLEPPEGAASAL